MKRILLMYLILFAAAMHPLAAQDRTVSGKVISADDGTALPGVNVVVKSTNIGTTTNAEGNYSLSVPANTTLVFSFIGLTTQEIAVGNRSVVDVNLASDVQALSEVVVTAVGIEREQKSLGYSVQKLNNEQLTQARETNVVNSLSGKVAGVQITGSPGVGASSRIVIRGARSISGNNQPLFVVDGVPISNGNFGGTGNEGVNLGNGAADINPDDIASITVLKGPNAAALYGSRASNGVVLITTKSGAETKGLGVSVNFNSTFENPLILPKYQNSYGQGSGGQFEFVDGAGGGVNDGVDESWGPKLDAGLMIPQFFSQRDASGKLIPEPWVSHPNNVKDFFKTGQTFTTNVAISGGNEKANARLSLTNLSQNGMVPTTELKRNTISLNAGVKLTDKFRMEGTANYVNSKSNNIPGYGYSGQNVMQQLVWFGRQVDIGRLKNYVNEDGEPFSWNYNYHMNPYFILNENKNTFERDRLYGNVKLSYQLTDWLTASVRTGTDYYNNLSTNRIDVRDLNDAPAGDYAEFKRTFAEVNSDFLLSANKNLGENFSLSLSVGGNRMTQRTQDNGVRAPGLTVPGIYNVGNSSVAQEASNALYRKQINSFYGAGQIGFKDYLFLDFTARNDWSSTLPKAHNSYFYPSVSLSGVITEMIGLQSNVLSFLKVRGSWAQVGSDTDPYRLLPVFNFGDADGWGSDPALTVPNTILNPELKPEISTSTEVGADIRLFNDRVSLDATYYDSRSVDQILQINISGASGSLARFVNAGEIRNRGVELLLNVTPLKLSNGFKWDVTFNFARNKNEVVSLPAGISEYNIGSYWSLLVQARPGQPFGVLYGYGYQRDPNGNIIHLNGLPQRDPALKVLGNYTPDWVGGINNSFSFKGINLGFLIDIKKGGDLYSMTSTWGRYAGVLEETVKGREGGIVGDGVKNIGIADSPEYVPNDVAVTAENYNKAAFDNNLAEGSVFDASFVKLREVKLGYTIPNKLFGRVPFRDVSLSVVGRNLWLISTNVPHVDPETAFSNSNVQGLEFGQLPSARSVGFNVNFKF
ncbi:SusC/RagA family TonB-linked outer membrane protein [Rhodocytophaga rosea]|uniref:SusC/RagA family TonB-linked outer membrane protein n=1 Tax=Rhodocytophaga rosea TaxID=2704465 RepID=A0A6C0GML1_9BACT|nr:SusC/RagA family TonB-linked outer membrane protein [Rhodocytophaga rosea]QHT69301.1 SusC/RagA family TonB-linked outer membrane protein [Rhodocytophaga rosea]